MSDKEFIRKMMGEIVDLEKQDKIQGYCRHCTNMSINERYSQLKERLGEHWAKEVSLMYMKL